MPFNATSRNPYPWLAASDLAPRHLTAAGVDVAHRLVELCMQVDDLPAARWAVDQAWLADIDKDSDIPWRDQMRVAAASGSHAELRQLLESLMTSREAEVPEDLDPATYQLLRQLLPDGLSTTTR